MSDKQAKGIEYAELSLTGVIYYALEKQMKKKDWEIIAIDVTKNKVIIRRYDL